MVALFSCSWGVDEEEGVKVGVTVVDFVTVSLRDILGVKEGVLEEDGEWLGVGVKEGVLVSEEPLLGVGVTEPLAVGVGLGEGSTMPCTYMPAP